MPAAGWTRIHQPSMEHSAPMFVRAVRVLSVSALVAAVAIPACGSSSDSTSPSGGAGGTAGASGATARGGSSGGGEGGASDAAPVPCGAKMCDSQTLSIPGQPPLVLPACCSDEATGTCGLDTGLLSMYGPSFPTRCQPRDQPGKLDSTCPSSTPTPVQGTQLTISFEGCCRTDTKTCGYGKLLGIFSLGLGCVDSSPFLDGGSPAACGEGAGGQGGQAGDSSTGIPGATGGSATGGAPG
jgi:hypothetical protein